MAITIIDRKEQKYFLSKDKYHKILEKLEDKIEKDEYFHETIYNIYFDNDEYELMNKSLAKQDYKEKVRLRCYEKPKDDTLTFLEIKKKVLNQSNKRRIVLPYKDAKLFVKNEKKPNTSKQITNELFYCFQKYQLKEKIKLLYDRYAYHLKEDENFRITFDYNIRYSIDNLDLKDDTNMRKIKKDGYIMEIKTLKGMPLWFSEMLTELKIYPTSYSKVGKIFTELKESEIYV